MHNYSRKIELEVKSMSIVLATQKIAPKTEVFQNGQILEARLISVAEYD